MSGKKCRRFILLSCFICALAVLGVFFYQGRRAKEAGPVKLEFFYENVCASCKGDADFYDLYDRCFTQEEREALDAEITTYNVFLDSCDTRYRETAGRLGIPEGTGLPVLVIGERWVSGYEQMEASLHTLLLGGNAAGTAKTAPSPKDVESSIRLEEEEIETLVSTLKDSGQEVLLLFTTDACEECEQVKEWLAGQETPATGKIIEYNIIQDQCLDLLKGLFLEYGTEEGDWQVPALFSSDLAVAGRKEITALNLEQVLEDSDNASMAGHLKNVKGQLEVIADGRREDSVNLLTLAGAGLLAGFNPCSISMLLMLLSLIVSERAGILKNGLLYLGGKYIAYFTIGAAIYVSAAQMSQKALAGAFWIINGVLAVLFLLAGIVYLVDAVHIFREDYGKIRTQLPVGLRRWNHNLIRRAAGYSGVLKPLLILGLGIAVSIGEFFCTGQIYMAAITYLLQDRASGIWLPFFVYVTAMSLPAFLMIILIQKTRNTESVSQWMLRHLGAIKIFNALLFLGFAGYFLLH